MSLSNINKKIITFISLCTFSEVRGFHWDFYGTKHVVSVSCNVRQQAWIRAGEVGEMEALMLISRDAPI